MFIQTTHKTLGLQVQQGILNIDSIGVCVLLLTDWCMCNIMVTFTQLHPSALACLSGSATGVL